MRQLHPRASSGRPPTAAPWMAAEREHRLLALTTYDASKITAADVDIWITRLGEFPPILTAQQQPIPYKIRW